MDINKVIIIVLLLVAVVGYIRLYRHYRRNIKKVRFLFDAIDNGDFSFNFPTEKRNKEDNILHQSLPHQAIPAAYTGRADGAGEILRADIECCGYWHNGGRQPRQYLAAQPSRSPIARHRRAHTHEPSKRETKG